MNFSTASSTTFPHQVEGAALLLGRSPPPFPFSVFPFRPGYLGLFGNENNSSFSLALLLEFIPYGMQVYMKIFWGAFGAVFLFFLMILDS